MTPFEWLRAHPGLVTLLLGLSGLTLIGTAALLPLLISRMPADYFVSDSPRGWAHRHPALRLTLLTLKNILGLILLLAGFALLFLPGQGILTILLGLSLTNFPGKRALELRLARTKRVRQAIAWLRRKAGKPPLRFPDEEDAGPAR